MITRVATVVPSCKFESQTQNHAGSRLSRYLFSAAFMHRIAEAVVAIFAAFLMLAIMPKLMPSSDVMTHLTARTQAALVGSFYPAAQRDNITVLLIDDDTLADLGQGWPVPYATHARWLSNLGSVYKPRAVFVDITFTQQRKDETLPQLVSALCRLRDLGIPVFLAAVPNARTGQLAVRQGLTSPSGEAPCFELVGVNYQPHQVDRLVWSYPLRTVNTEADGSFVDFPSSALAMAQLAANLEVPRLAEPMALTWGVNNRDIQRLGEWCRFAGNVAEEITPPRLRAQFAGEEVFKPICPYSRSLGLNQLKAQTEEDEAKLHRIMDGKFILLGAAISGTNDVITSPVHGAIPGVFMHAMALDNLLTYQDRYKRALEWELPPAWPLFWMGLLVVLTIHLLHLGVWQPLRRHWPDTRQRLTTHWPLADYVLPTLPAAEHAATPPPTTPATNSHWLIALTRSLLRLGMYVAGKLIKIIATSALILTLVVLLQKSFDVGTLPIVDLALMALVAEWLGWTGVVTNMFPWRRHPPPTYKEK